MSRRRGCAEALPPLILAARWEHRNEPEGADPLSRADIASGFALAVPLVEPRPKVSGLCQLAARIPGAEKKERFLGVVEVRDGEISFGDPYPPCKPDAWAAAGIDAWYAALIEASTLGLQLSGDRRIPLSILDGMREALFIKETGKVEEATGR